MLIELLCRTKFVLEVRESPTHGFWLWRSWTVRDGFIETILFYKRLCLLLVVLNLRSR